MVEQVEQNEKKQILVAVYEEGIGESLFAILEDEGYKVNIALSIIETLDMVKKSYPDMMIIDKRLISANARGVLKEIRKICSDLPIVMIAVNLSEEEKKTLGAFVYLDIPISLEELLLTVKKV